MDEIKQLTIRINANLYEEVKKLSESECRTVNQQIEYIIKKYLEIKKS